MKKSIIIILTMICAIIMFDVNVQAKNIENTTEELTYSTDIQSRIVVSYTKQVIKYYVSYNSIPATYYYTEYSDSYKTEMAGTLKLQSATLVGSSYRCVYEGTLFGNI